MSQLSRLIVQSRNGAMDRVWEGVKEITKGNGETITFKTDSGVAVTVSRETDWVLVEETDAATSSS